MWLLGIEPSPQEEQSVLLTAETFLRKWFKQEFKRDWKRLSSRDAKYREDTDTDVKMKVICIK